MVIDGKKIATEILSDLAKQVQNLPAIPVFCDVLVGFDPASVQYVNMKGKTAERIGAEFLKAEFPSSISTGDLVAEIHKLNREPRLCGLIVQLPLPETINRSKVLDSIDPLLDVDCTGSVNSQKFYQAQNSLVFPTAKAVLAALDSTGRDLSACKFLVIGQGQLVGRPVSFLLRQRGWNVRTADSQTKNLPELLSDADVVISAIGQPKFISGGQLKPGCIVIDAGTSEENGGIVGDVDFDSASQVASIISPVPGGVGPITVAMLLTNVLQVAREKLN